MTVSAVWGRLPSFFGVSMKRTGISFGKAEMIFVRRTPQEYASAHVWVKDMQDPVILSDLALLAKSDKLKHLPANVGYQQGIQWAQELA